MRWSSTGPIMRPNNAMLVVAGDVTRTRSRALAETHYGPLEPTAGSAAARAPAGAAATGRTPAGDGRCARVAALCRSRTYLAPERETGGAAEGRGADRAGRTAGRQRHDLGPGAGADSSTIRRRSMPRPIYDGDRAGQRHLRPGRRARPRRHAGRGRGGDGRRRRAVPERRRRSGGAGADQDAGARRADLCPRQRRRAGQPAMARR